MITSRAINDVARETGFRPDVVEKVLRLHGILSRLAAYMEKTMKLKKQIKSALVYPITISTIAVVVVTVILIFVVPVFQDMFDSLGGTLPMPTRIVVVISNFIQGIGGMIIGAAGYGFIRFIKTVRKTDKGLYITDKITLAVPIFGPLQVSGFFMMVVLNRRILQGRSSM